MPEEIYRAKIRGMGFVDEDAAFWLAVETLVISVRAGADFRALYGGILAQKFFDWIKTNEENLSEQKKAEALTHILTTEAMRFYAANVTLKVDDMFIEDIAPLGRALCLMLRDGSTKSAALAEQSLFGYSLHRFDDPDHEKNWPKAMSDISLRSMERKWKQYQQVLPHIMLIYLRQRAIFSSGESPQIEDLEPVSLDLRNALILNGKTRKVRLLPWLKLELH